ncbi:MAG TPA: NapC/NirT family cytochrome c [Rhodocyclaceae bacterium]|nr:NapC/NirT family cytochrome c [Rhodocyclaceae bacterium]
MSEATQAGRPQGVRGAIRHPLIRYPLIGLAGLVVLLAFTGGFTDLIESTNTLEFCTSCHDMSYNFEEYKKTTHYLNKSGVRAVCSDCHVPKRGWFTEMRRKVIAARDVWEEVMGTIDTREKFDAHRLEMAQREWARMREDDSPGCRNCHAFESMDTDAQDKQAAKKHLRMISAEGQEKKTCIDCHRGIAHKIPRGGED